MCGQALRSINGQDKAGRSDLTWKEASTSGVIGPSIECAGQGTVKKSDVNFSWRRATAIYHVYADESVRLQAFSHGLYSLCPDIA